MFDIIIDENLIVNISMHITILFIFLYFFFFIIVSKKGEKFLNKNINDISTNTIPILLDKTNQLNKEYGGTFVNWNKLYEISKKINKHDNISIDQKIKENNEYYKKLGFYILICLVTFVIGLYCYYTFYKKSTINIGNIISENILTFILIGTIEYVFFLMISSNYVTSYPTDNSTIILERIKYNLNKL